MSGLPPEMLERWPSRFRFPDLLVLLADRQQAVAPGPEDLARAVLGGAGGTSPRAGFEELLDRGEYQAAAYLLDGCADLPETEVAFLARRLETARAGSADEARQVVTDLARRARDAGVPFDEPDLLALTEFARTRAPVAETALNDLRDRLTRAMKPVADELERQLAEQEKAAAEDTAHPAATRALGGGRVRALLKAGELVAARALLNREPVGTPVPEAAVVLPDWYRDWTPEALLDYHLNPNVPRPPEFNIWQAADKDATRLLRAFDGLRRNRAAAAVEFADALGSFLGAPGGTSPAQPVEGGWFTSFDGLFAAEPLTRLHPTRLVDLYVFGPGTTDVPPALAEQPPHVAVGPDLRVSEYTDRNATAVLTLRDLLRLVVLPAQRTPALLAVLAPQWPVAALIGDSAEALERILGDDPNVSWLTLRWISRLALGAGSSTVQAMENCTGMDPGLLRVMLEYAGRLGGAAAGRDLWCTEAGAWQKDEALVHALRKELLSRCSEPPARAAWWAALATCDPETGLVAPSDLAVIAEICSAWPDARNEVMAGVETLLARGLLRRALTESRPGGAPADPGQLRAPLAGIVRTLRPGAEQRLTSTLETMGQAREAEVVDDGAQAEPGPRAAAAPHATWTAWQRNRYRPASCYSRYAEAEARGADAEELASFAATAEDELRQRSPAELAEALGPGRSDLGALLTALAEAYRAQYPDVHLDVRCPDSLAVEAPEALLAAALYEVLDNAAEALKGQDGGMVRVSVDQDSPEVIVEVRDNGPGLPRAARGRRVFHKDWTTRGAGRGQGLYRTRQFLQALSGPSVEAGAEAFDSAHPALSGAALRLVLPEAEAEAPDALR